MRALIFAIFFLSTAFGFFLQYLTYSRRNAPLPENVKDVYDEESYKKNQKYKMETLRFSIVTEIISTFVMLAFLFFNFHHTLYAFVTQHTGNLYLTSLFILLLPLIISNIVGALLGIYDTFVIEEKFGFNKTTPKTYILDFLKTTAILLVVGGGLLSLFLWLHSLLGNWVFLAFFFVLFAFVLFVTFISPLLIRIFYKLTPLEDGELKTKIEALAKETGYKLKGIYVVDASKRSSKMNAFAAGFGKTKTIGLFDTLIEKMTHDEIIGVLAHEIAHAQKKHVLKSAPLSLLNFAVICIVAYFVVTMPEVSQAFGFAYTNMAFGIFVMFIMVSPIMLLLQIPSNALSRKHEYEADAFEVEKVGAEVAISSMKKLYREDLGNLTPHPFVVMVEHSHPTASQRIAAMENVEKSRG